MSRQYAMDKLLISSDAAQPRQTLRISQSGIGEVSDYSMEEDKVSRKPK
jgi:hypothetical protein